MRIHILGAAGKMTLPIAEDLINKGNTVTGSDQDKIYPPVSDHIARIKLELNKAVIDNSIDLVIVGSAYLKFDRCVKEYEQAKKIGLNIISATEYLSKSVTRNNSIIIAGSYGKSTISALSVWIFKQAGLNPSYFVGADFTDNTPSISTNDSNISIIEGDESINGLDTKAKFLYYPVKHVILSSAGWEHKDSYKTAQDNINAYRQLLSRIPSDGTLIYNPYDIDSQMLASEFSGTKISYAHDRKFESTLIGEFNQQNISAAYQLAITMGISQDIALAAIKNFPGIKRRLEKVHDHNNILIYDDFAQSPVRVAAAIKAVRQSYPKSTIKIFFESQASFLLSKSQLDLNLLASAFKDTNEIILGPLRFSADISKDDRLTFSDYRLAIGNKIKYIPVFEDIIDHCSKTLVPGDILIHFSSGGLNGINALSAISRLLYTQ